MKSKLLLMIALGYSSQAFGEDLNPNVAPTESGSQMRTLEQIYNKLDTGAVLDKQTEFTGPTTGPSKTGKSLDEIYAKTPTIEANGAIPSEVLAGKKYWGLKGSSWGLLTGSYVLPTLKNSFEGSDGVKIIIIP